MPSKNKDEIIIQCIKRVPPYKYMGVTIDEKLHWSDHITALSPSKQTSRVCYDTGSV